jgi:hypothetical protein
MRVTFHSTFHLKSEGKIWKVVDTWCVNIQDGVGASKTSYLPVNSFPQVITGRVTTKHFRQIVRA